MNVFQPIQQRVNVDQRMPHDRAVILVIEPKLAVELREDLFKMHVIVRLELAPHGQRAMIVFYRTH